MYAGSLDGFGNRPGPPRGVPAYAVGVEDVTVQQLFNGAVLQIGWEDAGITDSWVRGVDVVGAEWYKTGGLESNDAVFSLRPPVYDLTLPQHHQNISVEGVRVDRPVGRLVGVGLFGSVPNSSVIGLAFKDITTTAPLRWWSTNSSAAHLGDNFVGAAGPDRISGVSFARVVVAGKRVRSDGDWAMNVSGCLVRYT